MATLTEKFIALNDADLSGLRARLEKLRADLEQPVKPQKGTNAPKSGSSKNAASADPQDFLAELETARRRSA